MKPSEFEISRSVESYNKKKAEDCYDTEKRLVSKLSKISIPNLNSTNLRLECRLCLNFTFLYYIRSEK